MRSAPVARPRSPALFACALLAVLAATLPPSVAAAEKTFMRPRFGLRGAVGIGGEAIADGTIDYRHDLQATAGVAAEVEVPIVRGYSIGVEGGAHAWRSDIAGSLEIDRNVLVDLLLVNRFRLAWGDRASHGAFYVAVPVGATASIARDGYAQAASMLPASEFDLGPGGGLNVGGRLGVQVFFGKVFGITVEGGYAWRLLRHRVETPAGDGHEQIRFGQGILQGGLVFAWGS